MSITRTITVNAVGDPEEIKVATVCRRVIIGEDDAVTGWPTTGWSLRMPTMTSTAVGKAAGKTHIFQKSDGRHYQPDEILGYVEVPSGSTTFAISEE